YLAVLDLDRAIEAGMPREPPEQHRSPCARRGPRVGKRGLSRLHRRQQQRRRATSSDEFAEDIHEVLAGLDIGFRRLGHRRNDNRRATRRWPASLPELARLEPVGRAQYRDRWVRSRATTIAAPFAGFLDESRKARLARSSRTGAGNRQPDAGWLRGPRQRHD